MIRYEDTNVFESLLNAEVELYITNHILNVLIQSERNTDFISKWKLTVQIDNGINLSDRKVLGWVCLDDTEDKPYLAMYSDRKYVAVGTFQEALDLLLGSYQ